MKFFFRYEYFIITKDGEKVTLHGEDQTKNSTVIGGNTLSFIIKQNYVTLQDFSILQVIELSVRL